VYDRARKRFITELGVEPGPALRARVQSIKTPAPTGNDLTREVAELQHKIDTLVARQAELLQRLQEQDPKLSTAH
jgi:predicted nuclease with TOPRIM domain